MCKYFARKRAFYVKKHEKCPEKVYDFQYFVKMKRKIYVMQHVFRIFVVPLRAFLGLRERTPKIE